MASTLYQPPRRSVVSGHWAKTVIVLLVLGGVGGFLYQRPPGWFTSAALSVLGLFGYEMVTVEVLTNPARADILLDGKREAELPLHVRKDDAIHRVSAIAPGYEPVEVTFKADGDHQLYLTLTPSLGK
jgi:hypothetical protein